MKEEREGDCGYPRLRRVEGPDGLTATERQALADPLVAELVGIARNVERELLSAQDGAMEADENCSFDEGLSIREPILIQRLVEHLRQTGRLK